MKARVGHIVALAAVSLFMLIDTSSSSSQTGVCSTTRLPSGASELLSEKFPLWRAKQISDLEEDDRQLWLKAHPKDCPGIAVGHFESPDQLAYAILLVPKAKSSSGDKIVVLSPSQSGSV